MREKVRSERRLTVRMIADELRMNSERVWRIITEDLGMDYRRSGDEEGLCENGTKVAE